MTPPDIKHAPDLLTHDEVRYEYPRKYKVILHNDDFTPMDYVVEVLINYFNKDFETATQIMLNVHQKGKGLCGIFPKDVAETKVHLVTQDAIQQGHPLKCTFEPE